MTNVQNNPLPRERGHFLVRLLTNFAELGRLPDAVIRLGIRSLLKKRLSQLEPDKDAVRHFLADAADQPVAVQTRAANDQHYEVPAEFFQTVLGPRLKYSCCYWPEGVDDLASAEEAALRASCEHANLENGKSILELGCGWGSLSLWMAEQFPDSRIVAVSNSRTQRTFITRQAEERGLDNLTVITADMNDFATQEQFDRIVSVEMFEHMRNHQQLMERIATWLRPGGQLFVHVFCHRHTPYLFETDGDENWMGRHFFTGGMMPSADLIPLSRGPLKSAGLWTWNGEHYAKTCRAWLTRQDAARSQLLPAAGYSILSDPQDAEETAAAEAVRRFHRWRLFFMACEELFAFNDGTEWFVNHYLFER